MQSAQVGLDAWCVRHGDARVRSTPEGKTTVGALAAAEPLRPVPAPFPATLSVVRNVSAQALVSFRGNRYSVPPELTGARVVVTLRLGASTLDIATAPGAATAPADEVATHDPGELASTLGHHQLRPGLPGSMRELVVPGEAGTDLACLGLFVPPARRTHRAPLTGAGDVGDQS